MKKKLKTQPKMVTDVVNNWKQMQGNSKVEKQINAFLTYFFVTGEAPSDECLTLAKKIKKLKNPTVKRIYPILKRSFGMGWAFNPGDKKGKLVDLTTGDESLQSQLHYGAFMVYSIIKFNQ